MKRITIAIILMTMTAGLSGCASFMDGVISCEMGIRNLVLAQKAWGHWSWCYDTLEHPADFACGFKAGYRNILDGGNGCQPTLPPQCYWKPKFQTPHGQCEIHAWFDGFSHGALAAKQDGYGNIGQIPISPTARANLEASRRRPQQQDVFFGGGYVDEQLPVDGSPIELTPPAIPGIGNGESNGEPGAPVPMRPYE